MKLYKYILLLLFPLSGFAQVEIDNKLVLTGTTVDKLQVHGVNAALDSTNAVSSLTYQSNAIHYAIASALSPDSILLSSSLQIPGYKPGMQLTFQMPSNSKDSVYINFNSFGWKKVFYKNKKIQTPALTSGQMVQVVYDGNEFEVLNSLSFVCPTNFIEVNDHYCIEKNETAASTFFNAIINCSQKNARLCTWNEWYYACQKSGLTLTNMINNYEWIDSATNSTNQVVMVGNTGCLFKSLATNTTNQFFRCCYSK